MQRHCNVFPHHPVPVQLSRAVSTIKRSRCVVTHIHAHATRPVLDEPSRQQLQQARRNSAPALVRNDIDPLQFPLAAKPACEMSRDVAERLVSSFGEEQRAKRQCLMRMMLAREIQRHARVTAGFTRLRQPDQARHVGHFCASILDRRHLHLTHIYNQRSLHTHSRCAISGSIA